LHLFSQHPVNVLTHEEQPSDGFETDAGQYGKYYIEQNINALPFMKHWHMISWIHANQRICIVKYISDMSYFGQECRLNVSCRTE